MSSSCRGLEAERGRGGSRGDGASGLGLEVGLWLGLEEVWVRGRSNSVYSSWKASWV